MANELRELRRRSGLSGDEVARSLGMSPAKLSRLERGYRGLQADDVSALLGLYRVPVSRRDELLAIVRSSAEPNWWQVEDGCLPADWRDLMRFEQEAEAIYSYETMVIPGLLQTAGYIWALTYAAHDDATDEEVNRLAAVRLERQKVLQKRKAPVTHFLIEESVLRRPMGDPRVTYGQLQHLVDSVRRANVVVQVVPLSSGLHSGVYGAFLVLEFSDKPGLLYMEHRGCSAFFEQHEHVASGRKAFRQLRAMALSCDDSVDLIASIGNELLRTEQEPPDDKPGSLPCSLAQEQSQSSSRVQLC